MSLIGRAGAVAAAALGCLIALTVAAEAAILWGVNGHPLVSYPGVTAERQLDLVKGLGATSYRVDVTSTDQIPRLAALIDAARARHMTILPVLIPVSDLAHPSEAQLYAAARDFAETFGRRFKGQVPVWELGNELENFALITSCEMRDDGSHYPCQWGLAGGLAPLDYYGPRYVKVLAVLRGLSDGIHAADPAARRAIGTSGWGHVGIFQRFKQDGLGWDISVWHMYGEDPEWAFKLLKPLGKPIWITEFGQAGAGPEGEAAQAQALGHWIRRIDQLAQPYDVEAAFLYELLDESYWGETNEARMGVVRLVKDSHGQWSEGPLKAGYAAVRDAIAAVRREAAAGR
ncbi:MAG TPA: hypothetical protein VHD15_11445 [Hyphomicrobiales bacterium]|nr:hypothetical protein [Hyphomicrobiales bacterium]